MYCNETDIGFPKAESNLVEERSGYSRHDFKSTSNNKDFNCAATVSFCFQLLMFMAELPTAYAVPPPHAF